MNLPISGILMPMGFCGILGGCLTLVGSSPLILLNDLMESWWRNNPSAVSGKAFDAFGLFSVTAIGLALVAVAIIYFILFGRFILPVSKDREQLGFMSSYLDDIYGERVGKIFELTVPDDFPAQTLASLNLRPLYHATIDCIAKDHGRRKILAPTRADVIEPGDVVGVISTQEHIKQLTQALGYLAIALILALGLEVKLSIALLTGAVGMVLSRTLTIDEAYSSVDWMTIFLLSGLIPLGIAFEKTGAAHYLALSLMHTIGSVSPFMIMVLIGFMTTFFTLVASNVGATLLLVPIAMNMDVQAKADPLIAALEVGIAASNTFILPTHQVNALIMRPGGYKTMDYVKAGTGMTVIFAVVVLAMLYLFYGIAW